MDERTRQQITWIVILALVASVVVFAAYRRVEVDMALRTIATGLPSARVAAVKRLIDKQKLMEALEDEPRWVQDRAVAAAMMVPGERALFQLVAAKSVVDEPVSAQIDGYLTSVGEMAVGPLVMALQDKDAAIRGGASGPLKTIGEPAVASLMPLIDVYDDAVRGLVSSTLGGIGEPAVAPLLRVMIQEEPLPDQGAAAFRRSKLAAVAAFKAMGEVAIKPVIERLLDRDDPEVRLAATDILGAVAAGLDEEIAKQAVPPLLERLTRDEAFAVRRKAAQALGGLADTALHHGAVPVLIGALNDPRSEVRAAAAAALGTLGDPAAAQPLANLLMTNRIGATAEIAKALQQIKQPAVAPLAPAVNHPELEVRLVAAQTLAAIGGADVVVPLGNALDDSSPKVRQAAADALRNLADVRVVNQLAQALWDSEAAVYYAARDALARIGAPAVPKLLEALGSGNARVAYVAQQALGLIGAPAVAPLIAHLRSPVAEARHWSAIALGKIGEPAVDAAVALLRDAGAPEHARVAAAEALGVAGSLAASKPLTEALRAAPPSVRRAAISALGKIGDADATQPLVDALKDPVQGVRDAAMAVLMQWRLGDVDTKLRALLGSADENAQRRAAILLAEHSPAASGELIRMVGVGQEPLVQEAEKVRGLLEDTVADTAASSSMRFSALAALAYVGTEGSLDALGPLLRAGSAFAEQAAKTVGRIGQRLAQEAEDAAAEAKRPTEEVRAPGAERATQLLLAVFDRAETDQLRLVAGSGLAVMGGAPVKPLIQRLQEGPERQRPWIAAILGAIGKPATDPLLDARGREKDRTRRHWLTMALTLGGDARAMDLIEQLPDEELPPAQMSEPSWELFVQLQELL
ncbi:MAG: HEAT repeat domain-containing protein [Armatimonadota bacterium]